MNEKERSNGGSFFSSSGDLSFEDQQYGNGETNRKQRVPYIVAEEGQIPGDYFPLDALSVQMQLGMYEYVDGRTANELRKVDRLRRQIVDGNPRIFEKKRLIPSVRVSSKRNAHGPDSLILQFVEYFNCSYEVSLMFTDMKCVNGKSTNPCHPWDEDAFLDSPILCLTLEECCKLITKGSKIAKLTLNCMLYDKLLQRMRHLIDSSLHISFEETEFESDELFDSLVQEPRGLSVYNVDVEFNDEFFRNAGRGTLELKGCSYDLWDERIAILVGRDDLSHISLDVLTIATAEGVRRAIQILIQSSTAKEIDFFVHESDREVFLNTLLLDSESSEGVEGNNFSPYKCSFTYGEGKVKVDSGSREELFDPEDMEVLYVYNFHISSL